MSGFKKEELNSVFIFSLFNLVVEKLLLCSDMMKDDCLVEANYIENHEEKIKSRLLENYLDNDEVRLKIGLDKVGLRFIPEVPESYKKTNDSYIGRVDIKVVTENWFRLNRNDYYIIECKRIDGSAELNKKFVLNGVTRFVLDPVQYPSFNSKNIMFGFVVKEIDIESNTLKIDKIQNDNLSGIVEKGFYKINSRLNQYYRYSSKYIVSGCSLELQHLFYNFSTIIKIR